VTALGTPPGEPAPELSPAAAEQLFGTLAEQLRGCGVVLDVGAGSGALGLALAVRGLPVVLVDLVDRREGAAARLPFLAGDATRLPIRSVSCGGVHLSRVLLHLVDWRAALAEIARVLLPGGVLCLSLGWARYQDVLRDLVGAVDQEAERRGLYREPVRARMEGPDEVEQVLHRVGLDPLRTVTVTDEQWITPRQAVADVVAPGHRWLPGQDLSVLPELGATVLATSGLAPDQPLPQRRTVTYRLYRRR